VRPMTALGIGIVGCGTISGIYMQNISRFPGLRLVACADLRADAARAAAEKYGADARPLDALLASPDIDIVVNLTVPVAHFAVSHAALTAGKHVFSEKPLCTDWEQGRELAAEAQRRGVMLGCAPRIRIALAVTASAMMAASGRCRACHAATPKAAAVIAAAAASGMNMRGLGSIAST